MTLDRPNRVHTMVSTREHLKAGGPLGSLLEANTEKLLTCVHCGLCLPACPTYRQLGNENDSPRGRIYLMRGVVEGRLTLGDAFISHIDLCLGCRGCESVCPSGVPYGGLLEAARAEVAAVKRERGERSEALLRLMLNKVFTRPWLLGALLAFVRWFRDSGLATLAFRANVVHGRFRFATALLLASRSPLRGSTTRRPPRPARNNTDGTRVSMLTGCVMEGLFRDTNRATRRVLARNACDVVETSGQVCCGALHAHAGQIETARTLAMRNIAAFSASGADRIIVNAAGCGAAMKEYGELLRDDSSFADRAREFSSKVRDISEYLTETGIEKPAAKLNRLVAYDAPCHLIHAQRITQAPIDLLREIQGIKLVPLRGFETCCGGAGIYNLQHAELSADILGDKIASIKDSGADTVATANPGCIMQIGAGVLLHGLKVDVVHPIDLLDAAYEERGRGGAGAKESGRD
ncbi:MAG TPA: heterodisulfide reductase-related iron-sulfur binding cluster [Blastocatellia bacterium]|nr:heterodisulfide reductase-related iron-sulfur binding cluster [Blastocatellia bacterium]